MSDTLFPNVVEVTGPKKGLDALLGIPKEEGPKQAREDRAARLRGEIKKEKP